MEKVSRVILDLGTWLTPEYLEKFKCIQEPFLKEELEKPNTILILSGGYTNPLFPYTSEAEEKLKLLISDGFPPEKILIEDRSIRTTQNLKFSFRLISLLDIKVEEIIITGEASSEKEVLWLAPRCAFSYLKYIPKITYFPIPYLNSEKSKRKKLMFPLIVLGYYFPPLDWIMTLLRLVKIRLKCFQIRGVFCTFWGLGCEQCKLLKHKIKGG